MTELLTKQDLLWLSFHKKLANLGDADIVEFSQAVLDFDSNPVQTADDACNCWACEDDLNHERCRKETDSLRTEFLQSCRPAQFYEYERWLKGYYRSGGRKTHTYEQFSNGKVWYLLQEDATLPELYGSDAINLIVPRGIKVFGDRTFHGHSGHSNIYFMAGFEKCAMVVPQYRKM